MDKISRTVSSWWQRNGDYEPIDIVESDGALEETDDVEDKPPPFSWVEYLIFGLLGMAMLWAW